METKTSGNKEGGFPAQSPNVRCAEPRVQTHDLSEGKPGPACGVRNQLASPGPPQA